MTKPSHTTPTKIVPILIPSESDQLARNLAHQQPTDEQGERVYRNLLAVLAVNHYFKILGLPTDLSRCDCWNPFLRMTLNVADLDVVGYGRFECCPISSAELAADAPRCTVPAEGQSNRIGYIAVQIDAALEQTTERTATILGFLDRLEDEDFPLHQLRSIFELPQYLDESVVTHLTHWLDGIVQPGWSILSEVIDPLSRRYSPARNAAKSNNSTTCERGKRLTIETSQGLKSVILIAKIIDNLDKEPSIELTFCPPDEGTYLPEGLDMAVLDNQKNVVLQAKASVENETVELGFHAERGDRFSLRLTLGDTVIDEFFQV